MIRRRATLQIPCANTKKNFRHSHLNENVQMKTAYFQFFEQQYPPVQEKQKIQLLSKSLKSLQNKYLNEEIPKNESLKRMSSRQSQQSQKKYSFREPRFLSLQTKNQNFSRFCKHSYFNSNQQSSKIKRNVEVVKTYDFSQFQLACQGSNSFRIVNGKELPYKLKKQHHQKKIQASFKIKLQGIPHHKLKINRQNKQNDPHQAKKTISVLEDKLKQNENKSKIKYQVKRLWQIKAINLKKRQNQMIHKLILKDAIPTVNNFQAISFKISEEDQEDAQQIKKKKRRLCLSHYDKVLKQLDQALPRYGLKQKAMSVTKIKMLEQEGKNLFKLY